MMERRAAIIVTVARPSVHALCVRVLAELAAPAHLAAAQSHLAVVRKQNDSEGIRTPAGRAQWISSPSP